MPQNIARLQTQTLHAVLDVGDGGVGAARPDLLHERKNDAETEGAFRDFEARKVLDGVRDGKQKSAEALCEPHRICRIRIRIRIRVRRVIASQFGGKDIFECANLCGAESRGVAPQIADDTARSGREAEFFVECDGRVRGEIQIRNVGAPRNRLQRAHQIRAHSEPAKGARNEHIVDDARKAVLHSVRFAQLRVAVDVRC